MEAAAAALSIVLASLLAFSAIRKLSHARPVVESYARAGVPEAWLSTLASLLLAGAAALVAGILWPPIGLAAAAALVAYFLVALGFHVRSGDTANIVTPLVLELLATAVAVLRVLTL